jgi:hypothetical protein
VRDHLGADVIVLRLLDTELEQPHGGRVTYLAEVAGPVRAAQPDRLGDSKYHQVDESEKGRSLALTWVGPLPLSLQLRTCRCTALTDAMGHVADSCAAQGTSFIQ